MSEPLVIHVLAWLFIGLLLMDVTIRFIIRPEWFDIWETVYGICYVISTFLLAVGSYIQDDKVSCAIFSFYCVIMAYVWWHGDRNKRKRKKLLDRVAGWVKDTGGRLKVVRPSAA